MCIRICIFFLTGLFLNAQTPFININGKVTDLENFEQTQKVNLEQLGALSATELFVEFELIRQYAIDEGAENDQLFLIPYSKALQDLKTKYLIHPQTLDASLNNYYKKLENEYTVQILVVNKSEETQVEEALKKKQNFAELITKYSLVQDYAQPKILEYYKVNGDVINHLKSMKIGETKGPFPLNNEQIYWVKKVKERKNLGKIGLQQMMHTDKKVVADVQKRVKEGEDFTKLIMKYSDSGKGNKGVLPQFITGCPDEIYEGIKNLKIGDYSDIIFSDGKYYLLRLLNKNPLKTSEDIRKALLPVYMETDEYYDLYNENLNKIDTVSTYKMYAKNIQEIIDNAPEWYIDSLNDKRHNKQLFSLGEYTLTQDAMLKKLRQTKADSITSFIMEAAIGDEIMENKKIYFEKVLFYQQPHLRSKIDSIKNALLIEYAFDHLILKRSFSDTEGMQEYISTNKEKFMLPSRAVLKNYDCVNLSVAKEVSAMIDAKKPSKEILEEFQKKLDSRNRPFVIFQEGKVSKESNSFPKNVPFEVGLYTNKEGDGRYVVSEITEILPPQLMTVEEAKMNLWDEYQSIYYKKTLEDLKDKANIHYNEEAMNQLKKRYKP